MLGLWDSVTHGQEAQVLHHMCATVTDLQVAVAIPLDHLAYRCINHCFICAIDIYLVPGGVRDVPLP